MGPLPFLESLDPTPAHCAACRNRQVQVSALVSDPLGLIPLQRAHRWVGNMVSDPEGLTPTRSDDPQRRAAAHSGERAQVRARTGGAAFGGMGGEGRLSTGTLQG